MNYLLENQQIKVEFDSFGAEITSVVNKEKNKEVMWDANPSVWKRHAPVLFPLVGKYRNNTFKYDGKEYQSGQHGFARDMEFELLSQSESEIAFVLRANEETLEKYPFNFELIIKYIIEKNEIKVVYIVNNIDTKTVHFSIGAHPAFVTGSGDFTDGKLVFNGLESTKVEYKLLNSNGVVGNEKYSLELDSEKIANISSTFFEKDALILEDTGCKSITLMEKNEKIVTVNFDAPLVGIWSAGKDYVPFVCIEPWYGRTDGEGFDGTLEEREWGNKIAPGESFEMIYSIVVEQ